MKLRRCDGCGETSEHTSDWGTVNVPIVDLLVDICTPKCGVTALAALIPSTEQEAMGKSKWSIPKFRKHLSIVLGKRSPEDWCPHCDMHLVRYRSQGDTSGQGEGRYCGNCGYNQDPKPNTTLVTNYHAQADRAEELTLDLEGER